MKDADMILCDILRVTLASQSCQLAICLASELACIDIMLISQQTQQKFHFLCEIDKECRRGGVLVDARFASIVSINTNPR